MGGIEKLTRFQYHFDDVLVEVPTGCLASFPMEDKDIHVGGQLYLSLLWRRRGLYPLSVDSIFNHVCISF